MLVLAALLLAASCEKEKPAMPPSAPTPAPPANPVTGPAQPRLETIKLYLGATELTVEIADENHERMAGMMHRTTMPENEGMLFVFPYPHQTGFWMKNTTVPLSIAYIDRASRVIEIYDMHPRVALGPRAVRARGQPGRVRQKRYPARHGARHRAWLAGGLGSGQVIGWH